MTAYAYPFIKDLPSKWPQLASDELKSLAPIWQERKQSLSEAAPELVKFNERLRREWAIETGIIENLYSIDRGTTQLLIEQGFVAGLMSHGTTNKPPEQIVVLLKDQEQALEHVFQFVAQRRLLSTSYIKQLHDDLTRNQPYADAVDSFGNAVRVPLLRGQWKKQSNNPMRTDELLHEYCPPVQVDSEMDQLIAWHVEHETAQVPPEVEAAWLHHRFTQIHPFQDGNGRVARALASLIYLRAGWFPLVINRDLREDYITALEKADTGDLQPLVRLFAKTQKDAFVRALGIAGDVQKGYETRHQIIAAAAKRFRERNELKLRERRQVFSLSNRLEQITLLNLQMVAAEITAELRYFNVGYFAHAKSSSPEEDHYYRSQIETIARQFGYFADTRSYRAWVRLKIREDRQTEIIFSFHSLGVEFLGVMVASAFLQFKDAGEDGEAEEAQHTLCTDIFQFSYNDPEPLIVERYEAWMNEIILTGLDQWRRQI